METSECASDELRSDKYESSDVADARGTQRSAAGDGVVDDASKPDDATTRSPPAPRRLRRRDQPLPAWSGIEDAKTPCDGAV